MLTATLAIVVLGTTLATGVNIQPAHAQIVKGDGGASEFAPGEIIGPEAPGDSKLLAPGQIIGPEAPGLSQDFSPGQKALLDGIIGPE